MVLVRASGVGVCGTKSDRGGRQDVCHGIRGSGNCHNLETGMMIKFNKNFASKLFVCYVSSQTTNYTTMIYRLIPLFKFVSPAVRFLLSDVGSRAIFSRLIRKTYSPYDGLFSFSPPSADLVVSYAPRPILGGIPFASCFAFPFSSTHPILLTL